MFNDQHRNTYKYMIHLWRLIGEVQFESVYFDVPLTVNQRITIDELRRQAETLRLSMISEV